MAEARRWWTTAWTTAAALALAILIALVGDTVAHRMTNLRLTDTGLPDTYIMFSKSDPGRCYVVDRRDSTMRRSNRGQPGQKWEFTRFRREKDTSHLDSWLVMSKRKGKGTVFFLPVDDVRDWAFPLLYQFVAKQREDLELPRVSWTQLYVNRYYQGLYLRVGLPFDLRKKDGGSGTRRELLTVVDDRLTKVDTVFDDACQLYVDSVVGGFFPRLTPPDPALAWLARRCPSAGTTFLMSNLAPHDLSLLPLPVSLSSLHEAIFGRPPSSFVESRYQRWTHAEWRTSESGPRPFTDGELVTLRSEFDIGVTSFLKALRLHSEFHQNSEDLKKLLPERQKSLKGLDLAFGEV